MVSRGFGVRGMPGADQDRRRRTALRRRVLAVLLLAVAGAPGGRVVMPSLPPLAWLAYVGHFTAGPRSTLRNHGHGPPDQIASIPAESYAASVRPAWVGVQFIGASAPELRRQHLTMTVKTGR